MITYFVIAIYVLLFQFFVFFMAENAVNAIKEKSYIEFLICALCVLVAEIFTFIVIGSEFYPLLKEVGIFK